MAERVRSGIPAAIEEVADRMNENVHVSLNLIGAEGLDHWIERRERIRRRAVVQVCRGSRGSAARLGFLHLHRLLGPFPAPLARGQLHKRAIVQSGHAQRQGAP